jgi:ParB family chromosome partitioning protein
MLVKLSDIKIGNRFRQDLGDIAQLADSIERHGLLHPVVISDKNELVCGRRRIEAYQKLGRPEIEVNIVSFAQLNEAEAAENMVRKNFTKEEIIEIDKFFREREELAARERQRMGGVSEIFAKGRSSAKIALLAGISDRTLEKIRVVKEAATKEPAIFDSYWNKLNSEKISVDKAYRKVKQRSRMEEVRKAAIGIVSAPIRAELKLGDMNELGKEIQNDSIDLIFTDPPYNEKSLPLYDQLAKLAQRVLKPGGSLVTYAGHYAIPEIIKRIENNSQLQYHWQLVVKHSGNSKRMHAYRIWVKYKPLLWYYKKGNGNGPTIYKDMADLIESEQAEKNMHEWEQSTVEAAHVIKSLTVDNANHIILDPFMGSGTTGQAALELHRKFIGIELDKYYYGIAAQRLASVSS